MATSVRSTCPSSGSSTELRLLFSLQLNWSATSHFVAICVSSSNCYPIIYTIYYEIRTFVVFRWTWRANSPFNCSRRFSFCRNLNLPYCIVVGVRFGLLADNHRSLRRRSETWKYPLGQSETIGNQNSRFRQFMSDRSTSKCCTMLRSPSMHHLSLSMLI